MTDTDLAANNRMLRSQRRALLNMVGQIVEAFNVANAAGFSTAQVGTLAGAVNRAADLKQVMEDES